MTSEERAYREDRRTDARERALGLLYEAEAKDLTPREVLAGLAAPADPLAVLLVEGVEDHQPRIDELLGEYAEGWTLPRMLATDRNVARVAVFELLGRPDVPTAVILDEAVELAKRFGSDESGRFVNGLLSAIARKVRPPAE